MANLPPRPLGHETHDEQKQRIADRYLADITCAVSKARNLGIFTDKDLILAAARGLQTPLCVADPGNSPAVPDDVLGLLLPWKESRPAGCAR